MNPAYLDTGNLQIFVTAGENPDPIPGARVRISDPENGELLEEVTTDASGQTPFVELPAPPIELSVAEGESDQRPYAVYNVTISAQERQTLHIGGVEVLPTGRSIQRAALAPARPGGFNVRNLLLAPHGLWGEPSSREPEEEVKPLPEPEGLVVLPEPVIPEFIVVHAGRPAARSTPPGRRRPSRPMSWRSSPSPSTASIPSGTGGRGTTSPSPAPPPLTSPTPTAGPFSRRLAWWWTICSLHISPRRASPNPCLRSTATDGGFSAAA